MWQDNSTEGIKATMASFMDLLQAADPELHDHLVVTNKVSSQAFLAHQIFNVNAAPGAARQVHGPAGTNAARHALQY